MDALRLDRVDKQYGRGNKALDGLTCRFPSGSICRPAGRRLDPATAAPRSPA